MNQPNLYGNPGAYESAFQAASQKAIASSVNEVEENAWHLFEQTGRITDYLNYRAVKDSGEGFTNNADNGYGNRDPREGFKQR